MRVFAAGNVLKPVLDQTAFQTTSGFYFAFAFLFVIAYIIVVTGGSWGWLRRKNQVRHAWVIFALLAAATSGISLAAVQLVRTLGQGVHEMTIVNGRQGADDITATAFLGFKTASHTLVDLCVPANSLKPGESPETARGSLRPIALESVREPQNTFSVPQRYEAVAQLGELRGVPIRATLKQFEVAWRGPSRGRISSNLGWSAIRPDRLEPWSSITNELDTDLTDCYLFTRGGTPPAVRVYALPDLPRGQRADWGAICTAMEERWQKKRTDTGLRDRVENATDEKRASWSPPMLKDLLGQCLDELSVSTRRQRDDRNREQDLLDRGAERYVPSLLVLTFYDDASVLDLVQSGQDLVRGRGRELEMSSNLDSSTALFAGFSTDPSPLRLCRRKPGAEVDDWKAIKPSRSAVMYRYLLPILPAK
jgi:hypothetical protein